MKKVLSIGLGVLLCIALSPPAAADDNAGGLAGVFEQLYTAIGGWFGDDLESQPMDSTEVNSPAPGEHANSNAGTPPGPGVTAEMSPMTLPGG